MYTCWHGALAQVEAGNAVFVKALVAKLERGLPARHLGKMGNKLGDGPVLHEN